MKQPSIHLKKNLIRNMERSSGILLHPTSLPGKYGIGTLGHEARSFIDFLVSAKQQYWQILPLGPTGFADSPYQCFSSNAGNPLLIDLETLVNDKLLHHGDLVQAAMPETGKVDYGKVIDIKYALLRKAARRFQENTTQEQKADYREFLSGNAGWLNDYSLFMALKGHFGQKPWYHWEQPLKMHDRDAVSKYRHELSEEIEFQKFIQYLFFTQWTAIRDYAHQNNIRIIGDIPLYVAHDSVDVWSSPEMFQLDGNKDPVAVGGVPPDYFSETGQLWGNPLFDWDRLEKDHFSWWISRIRASLTLYDLVRIDHFRGFAAYWSVPYGEKTAVNGKWIPAPGKALFAAIQEKLGDIPIIAEDLGVITEDVEELRDSFGLPGMKILQFAFDPDEENDYLPHNYPKNCVVYTGTHDNDTLMGWYHHLKKKDREFVLDYIHTDGTEINWDFIRLAWASVACTAVVPMQDLLGLGTEARMNLPGTTASNWVWRAGAHDFSHPLSRRLAHLTELYGRCKKTDPKEHPSGESHGEKKEK
jgi:4-alpha-glucanotransferase